MFISKADGLKAFNSDSGDGEIMVNTNKATQIFNVDPTPKLLNKRQKEVLIRLAKGMTVYAISKELGIAEDTIRFHKKGIFDKLGANCTVQAVVKAIQHNYISLSEI